jgi:hippurate hydrolase
MLLSAIQQKAKLYANEFIEVRQWLHALPELSYQEFETSKFIQTKLTEWDISFQVKEGTGIVGKIVGIEPASRIMALRADMDALPIQEENTVSYRSTNDGVMHACGHDVHTTCLMGAVKILNELKHAWKGTVKVIFQPGEERNPGGANLLLKEGA